MRESARLVEHLQLGIDLAITGMLVVFTALAAIATSIALLPRVIRALEVMIGPERAHHAPRPATSSPAEDVLLALAIGTVLAAELEEDE